MRRSEDNADIKKTLRYKTRCRPFFTVTRVDDRYRYGGFLSGKGTDARYNGSGNSDTMHLFVAYFAYIQYTIQILYVHVIQFLIRHYYYLCKNVMNINKCA